ncbi:hypothetical protein [Komagataeibacter sp. NFXK3]
MSDIYKVSGRNIIERFFARLKQFTGIATCYDKLKSIFLAAVQLAVAINSKSLYVTQQDRPMTIMRCDGLSPASLDAVSRKTMRISNTIATGHVHRQAVPELDYDSRSGKNETEAD